MQQSPSTTTDMAPTRDEVLAASPDMTGKKPVSARFDIIEGVLPEELQAEHKALMAPALRAEAALQAVEKCERDFRMRRRFGIRLPKGQKKVELQASHDIEVERLKKELAEIKGVFDASLGIFIKKVRDAFPGIDPKLPLIIRDGSQVGHSRVSRADFMMMLMWC